MQLKLHPLKLALKRPFTITYGTFHYREALVVELIDQGLSGFGEATAISYYGKNIADFIAVLETHRNFIEQCTFAHPSELHQKLSPYLQDFPFVQCALDVAAYDLWAKRMEVPLYKALNLSTENLIVSNFTIGIDTIPQMVEQIQATNFPIYKIKLGTPQDIAIIEALRNYTDAIFRVDANGAWTVEETLQNAKKLKKLGVEFIEQPLAKDNWEGMKEVYRHSVLPIMADESCQIPADIARCHQHFHGVNIKLMKCGGITPALKMIAAAKALGLKVMLGCMTESSIGISAIAHLSPLLDYVDMDGALLLANDPAIGVRIEKGKIVFSDGNGLGAFLVTS